jgi:hypothetical protein
MDRDGAGCRLPVLPAERLTPDTRLDSANRVARNTFQRLHHGLRDNLALAATHSEQPGCHCVAPRQHKK